MIDRMRQPYPKSTERSNSMHYTYRHFDSREQDSPLASQQVEVLCGAVQGILCFQLCHSFLYFAKISFLWDQSKTTK